ncbi:MAG TPA: EAL domain-containing protein [Jatrophihabitans sp.]|nr:EAL domain-containing protein [Jatrophihabitans sp.]
MAERSRLRRYLNSVVAAAIPLIVLAGYLGGPALGRSLTGRVGVVVWLFALVLVLGELWPIPVARGQEAGDEITVSSTFGFGLLLVAPVLVAIAAQAIALTVDATVRRRPPDRLLFNMAQYAIAFMCTRGVYAALAGQPFTPPSPVPLPGLAPAVLAAITFLLVNNLLVGVAVAISVHLRIARVLLDDVRWQITTSAPLLGLGPLAVQAMFWNPFAIVLLVMPIAALHRSGTMAQRREQEALRDNLTGLANRAMLVAAAEDALAKSVGLNALLLLDLDHFKDINDTLGHGVGDEMLVAVAARLRAEAGRHDLIARLGGDEFVVLSRSHTSRSRAVELAERLCAAVREPVVVSGMTLTVGCSVGVAFAGEHARTVPELLRCADIALYEAKETRGGAVQYRPAIDQRANPRVGLPAELRLALEDGEQRGRPARAELTEAGLWVAYQPQLHVATGSIESVECLIRWRHPQLGDITPEEFIPVAENTAMIDRVLDRVLADSLRQLAEWDRLGLSVSACVNLSARQLSNLSLPARIGRHLHRYGVAADRLVLEVTEDRLLSDPEHSARIISQLRELGVQISIDDFGTGYSSLAYLQRLAVQELKIDLSFTGRLDDPDNATIVHSSIELGHNLGLRVVAEGVEDEESAERLTRMGCDVLQGYLIGRPAPADELADLLLSRRPSTPGVDAEIVPFRPPWPDLLKEAT